MVPTPPDTAAPPMNTDAIDLKYAKEVADHIGSDHKEIIITRDDVINSLEDNSWTLKASDQKIAGTDEGISYTLVPASENQINQVNRWDDELHGGSAKDEYLYTDITDDPATHPSN